MLTIRLLSTSESLYLPANELFEYVSNMPGSQMFMEFGRKLIELPNDHIIRFPSGIVRFRQIVDCGSVYRLQKTKYTAISQRTVSLTRGLILENHADGGEEEI